MGVWIDVTRLAIAVNVLLLLGLCLIWGRNYAQLRSKHALGLLVFGVLLLAENVLAGYFFMLDPVRAAWFSSAVPDIAGNALMALRIFETAALVFLGWTTWD